MNLIFFQMEKIMIDRLEKDEVEKYLDAKYQFYYIRKKDFNKDKWWLGWTCDMIRTMKIEEKKYIQIKIMES